jgi:hypothetical protein
VRDFSQYQRIGETTNTEVYIAEPDNDILIIVPRKGTADTAQHARENVQFTARYVHSVGKKCASVIVMANLIAQDAETRRIYADMNAELYYGAALVVENALSRAMASFFIGLSRPVTPIKLFDTLEKAMEWLRSIRPA